MIPRHKRNRKARINVKCPTCGMDLSEKGVAGFTRGNETYCCQGCADGTGCTCAEPRVRAHWKPSRAGAIEQREPGETTGLHTPASTATPVAKARRMPSRKAGARTVPKRKRNVTKERDSTRQQARGRAEFTGSSNRGGATRVSRTGTKSRKG